MNQSLFFLPIVILGLFYYSVYAALPVIDFSALIQLGHQLTQLKKETKYLAATLKKLRSAQYRWSDTEMLINRLEKVVSQMSDIAYSAIDIDKKFRQIFPGYQSSVNYENQYKRYIDSTLNTLNAVLKTAGMTAKEFKRESKRLAFLQRQIQQAKGPTQAIQASAQIASELVSQLQLMRQLILSQSNAQTAYFASNLQTQASSRIALSEIIRAGSTEVPAYGTSGETITIP